MLKVKHFITTILYLWSVKEKQQIGPDFVIDKLTNSIENVVTGDSFSTDITLVSLADLKNVNAE